MIRSGDLLQGRYELTERIAVGGMGEVWQALDRSLGRTVAAKVLRDDLVGDEVALARLRVEARNSSGVIHPNVAMLLDYGEQDGAGFLIMEYVAGEPLSAILSREGVLAPHRALTMLAQCALALHAAHEVGVVHRDVKPSNIVITPEGTIKLTDFGISLGVDQPALTAAGMVMGTAQYLPPELALGHPAQPPGDVYALGVVAYEALTGKRPFTGENQVEIAFAHVKQPVPALPRHLPRQVRTLVMEMLAKDPSARPAPAAEVTRPADEILATLAPPPAPTRPAADVLPTHLPAPGGNRPAARVERGAAEPPAPGSGRPTAAPAAVSRRSLRERRWRRPTWRQLTADRRWLVAVGSGLLLIVILALTLGTLALGQAQDGAPDVRQTDRLTVRDH